MARINLSTVATLYDDRGSQTARLYRLRNVSDGDVLDLRPHFARVDETLGMEFGFYAAVSPSTSRYPILTLPFAGRTNETLYLLVLGEPA